MNNALHNRDCPPLMSDGRSATDYRPSCDVHSLILKQNQIKNSHELRMFLQRNADTIRENNTNHYLKRNACGSCEPFHVDPNGHDKYWNNYKEWIGYNKQ